jgi:Flp pilus assembly protein TadG
MILHRTKARRGATVVEMTFVALICLTLMFAIFEYGRFVFMRQVMENAARTGARDAVVTATSYVPPATADSALRAQIDDALAGQSLLNKNVQIYQADDSGNNIGAWTSTPFGRNIAVQIDGDLPLLFPTFGMLPSNGAAPNSIHITVKAIMRGEAN